MRWTTGFAALLGLSGLLNLSSCGKDASSPTKQEPLPNVVGTLTLPSEANGKSFAVVVDEDTTTANGFVKVTTGTCGAGTQVSYQIQGVPAGVYYVYAVVWVVSTPLTPPTSGDYVGYYGTQGTIPAAPNATVPREGTATFDITLIVMP
ncbi:MAG: hypothetical protein ACUVTG_03235 [Candidatus Oleimicrobiaceae bacterium]